MDMNKVLPSYHRGHPRAFRSKNPLIDKLSLQKIYINFKLIHLSVLWLKVARRLTQWGCKMRGALNSDTMKNLKEQNTLKSSEMEVNPDCFSLRKDASNPINSNASKSSFSPSMKRPITLMSTDMTPPSWEVFICPGFLLCIGILISSSWSPEASLKFPFNLRSCKSSDKGKQSSPITFPRPAFPFASHSWITKELPELSALWNTNSSFHTG